MGFLDKVYAIWKDPEATYAEKGAGKTRTEFLYELISYKGDGSHVIDLLKTKVAKVRSEDEEKATYLIKLFDSLSEVDWGNIGEVVDLNEFVSKREVGSNVLSYTASSSWNENILDQVNPYLLIEDNKGSMPWQTLLGGKDFATDVFQVEDVRVVGSKVDLVLEEGVLVFKSVLSLIDFTESFKVDNPFYDNCYNIISTLMKEEKFPKYAIFLARDKYTLRGDKINVINGKDRISLEYVERGQAEGTDYILCKHVNDFVETPVYCI